MTKETNVPICTRCGEKPAIDPDQSTMCQDCWVASYDAPNDPEQTYPKGGIIPF